MLTDDDSLVVKYFSRKLARSLHPLSQLLDDETTNTGLFDRLNKHSKNQLKTN